MVPRSEASANSLKEDNRWCLRCLGFYTGVYPSKNKPVANYYCRRNLVKCARCAEPGKDKRCLMIQKEQWPQTLEIIEKTRQIILAEQADGESEKFARDRKAVKDLYRHVERVTRAYHNTQLQDDQQSAVSDEDTPLAYNTASDDEEMGEIQCAQSFAGPSRSGRSPNTAGLSRISKFLVDIRRLEEEKAEASRRLGRAVWIAARDPQAIGPSDQLVRLVVDELHRDARQGDARHGIIDAFRFVDNAHEAREEAFRRLGDLALAIMPASSTPEGTGSSGSGRAPNSRR
ncbi:uncharacterized protein BDZ83DRAFT_747704 [Colletotrichum acutatum]|uniref:Uncharacterized protein n=1 Tax=Glomerella acutata TaxID=27357 RepID=A0AAD8XMG2_GLOAC|nr:uncharacterized protein BDZ83DRAFT_747704 [Colletotrichum acutatum]KAK1730066.1 hypothetical protein BDZ83DRAFT_747704 [Colletotrichum acutatum]